MEPVQPHLDALVSAKAIHGSSGCEDDRKRKELITSNGESHQSSSGEEEEDEIVKDEKRRSNVSVCSVEVDLELGLPEKPVHLLSEDEKDCRICHMSLESVNLESGVPIELGCSCKNDLAAAHKHCAETWFKIKGNKICEVCGSIAGNVIGTVEPETENSRSEVNGTMTQAMRTSGPRLAEARSFWQALRGAATLKARAFKEVWSIAAVIPVEKGIPKGGVSSGGGGGYQGCLTPEDNFLGICSRELLAKGCELLKRTREGDLHWKVVSVYINRTKQVMLKMKSKHVAGTITKKKKYVVVELVKGLTAWPGRELLEGGEDLRYFGLKTLEKRVIEFECKSQREYDLWTQGVSTLLSLASDSRH